MAETKVERAQSEAEAEVAQAGAPKPRVGRRALRVHGWRVTGAATANQAIVSVPTFQGSSAIFASVEAEYGWSRTVTSGAASFGSLVQMVMGPFLGVLTDRIGPARMMLVGLLLAGAGLIAFSRLDGPGTYYLFWLMVSVGTSIGGFIPSIAAVNSWMAHRRATAMALVLAGGSIGALLVPVMAWGMAAHGWRTALIGVGVAVMLSAPLIAWVMWRRPPDMRRPARGRPAGPARPGEQYDFTPKQALRTKAFWAISGAHSLANLSVSVVQSQVVLHLEAVGLSITKASLVLPVMGATAFAAQIAGGLIGDRFDKRYAAAVFLLLQGVAVAVLAFTESFGVAMVFAALWGVGFGGRTPVLHAMRGDFFGRRHYATIMSFSAVPMALGMTVAPLVAGRVFDLQGTYRWVLVGLASACVAAAWVVLYARRPRPPEVAV